MDTRKDLKPIVKYIPPFLDYCEIEKGLSNNTQRNYKQYLKLFVDYLKKNNNKNLFPHELTPDHIWNYRLYLARTYKTRLGEHLGKKSQNYYLIAVRAFLDFLADRDIETLPSSKVKLAKQKTDVAMSFLEVKDIKDMLKIPDTKTLIGLRDRTIMELFFSSGMRISELVALNINQTSFLKDKNLKRTFELSIIGKGKNVRTIFISPRAALWLRTYLSSRKDMQKPLFISHHRKNIDDNHRLTPRSIQKMISKCALYAGISKKVTPHTLRHTYATDLLGHGADLRSVQELLGHKNVATTQIYTHITNKGLKDIHEKFHGGEDFKNN